MRYNYFIEQAIRAASVLHKDQVCKGPVPYPYITHIFAVAMIVSDYTDDENCIVSALLHDTLIDTDYTEQELEDDFGGTIKDIVISITEMYHNEHDTKQREKMEKDFLKQLKIAHERALIVLAADKIHTMRSVVENYIDDLSGYIAHYGSHHDKSLYMYQEISNALNRRLRNAILTEFNNVFSEYKKFIHAVKEKSEQY